MYRRSSSFFRGRQSLVIVNETRGVPLKIVSLLLGLFLFARCGQVLLFCDQESGTFLYSPFLTIVSECKTDPYQFAVSRMMSCMFAILGVMKLQVAFAKHVAELYSALLIIVGSECFAAVSVIQVSRMGGEVPTIVIAAILSGIMYESYILYLSRRAHLARLKMTKTSVVPTDQSKRN